MAGQLPRKDAICTASYSRWSEKFLRFLVDQESDNPLADRLESRRSATMELPLAEGDGS